MSENKLRLVWIPNQLSKDGRIEINLPFQQGQTLLRYLELSTFDFQKEGVALLASQGGKIEKPEEYYPIDGEEILVLREVGDPISLIVGVLTAIGVSAGVATFVANAVVLLATLATIGFSIYQAVQKPKKPSFGGIGGIPGGSIEESSPTYGWNGIQTIQDVGVPIGIVYGEHRLGGNIINQYVTTDGKIEYLNLLLALCEGEIESIDDLELNDNPSANFSGITEFKRYGTNTQTVIEGFEKLHSVNEVGASLTQNNAYTYTTIDGDVESFEVEVSFPTGLFEAGNDGGMIQLSVDYKIEYRDHSAVPWTDLGTFTVSEASRTAVQRKVLKDGLAPSRYDIRVTRLSEDATTLKISEMRLARIDEIKNDDLMYPNTALLGLKLLASDQLSGATPKINVTCKGLKITTYDVRNAGVAVAYDLYYYDSATSQFKLLSDNTVLTWDGVSYVTAWSANPAWCIYDLIINNRYGMGEFIATTNIDLAQFVSMAKYCDGKVADGNGGYEKRFRLDVVIDSAHKATDILIQLCGSFRAFAFYSAGAIKIKIDQPESAVQLFGMGNIIEGSFQQAWKSRKDINNVIEMQYLDASKRYEQEIIAHIDEASLEAGDPKNQKSIRCFVTSVSRAVREARYALLLSKYIHRTVSFRASIDAIACQSGDVISVSHELPQWGNSGRVVSGTATTVVLDKSVTIAPATSYKVRVRHPDDTIEEKTVTNAAGTYTTLTISGSWTTNPALADVWAFGETSIYKKDFRIINMKRDASNEIEIQATEYSSSVYDDSAPTLPNSNFTDPTDGIPSVSDLLVTERVAKMNDGTIQNVLDVWWNKPDLSQYPFRIYDKARIYLSDDGGESFTLVGESKGTQFTIMDRGIVEGVLYTIAVTSVDVRGREKSLEDAPTYEVTALGKSAPPSDVTGFDVSQFGSLLRFTWDAVTDVDLARYVIKKGGDWATGEVVAELIDTTEFTAVISTTGTEFYMIKAVDTSGNESDAVAIDSIDVLLPPDMSISNSYDIFSQDLDYKQSSVQLYQMPLHDTGYTRQAIGLMSAITWEAREAEALGWEGEEAAGSLVLEGPVVSSGYWEQITPFDLGTVFEFNIVLDPSYFNVTGGTLTVKLATSEDGTTYTSFATIVAGTNYRARYVKFQINLATSNTAYNILLYDLAVFINIPASKVAFASDVLIPVSGSTISYGTEFTTAPRLKVTIVNGIVGVPIVNSKTATDFHVEVFNLAGASIGTAEIDWEARGS